MNQHKNYCRYPVISCYKLVVSLLVYTSIVLYTCTIAMASPTPRSSQITTHKDCRVQLLPQIEGCLLGFIQHYKIYRDTDAKRKDELLGNLCHSYGETLQCLHLAFLKCAPSDIHLNFMEVKLPNPTVMQRLCFSSNEDNGDKELDYDEYDAVKSSSTKTALKSTTTAYTHYNKHPDKIETNKDTLKRSTIKLKTTTEAVFQLGNSLRVHVHDNTKVRETEHRKTKDRSKLVLEKGSDVVISSTTEKRQNEHQHSYSLKQTQNNVYGSENTPSYGSAVGSTDIIKSLKNDCEGDMQLVNPLCSNKQQSNSSVTNSLCIYNVIISIGLAVLITILQQELYV